MTIFISGRMYFRRNKTFNRHNNTENQKALLIPEMRKKFKKKRVDVLNAFENFILQLFASFGMKFIKLVAILFKAL